jgi:hypothetical protein
MFLVCQAGILQTIQALSTVTQRRKKMSLYTAVKMHPTSMSGTPHESF